MAKGIRLWVNLVKLTHNRDSSIVCDVSHVRNIAVDLLQNTAKGFNAVFGKRRPLRPHNALRKGTAGFWRTPP
jgi:hypothetical protein